MTSPLTIFGNRDEAEADAATSGACGCGGCGCSADGGADAPADATPTDATSMPASDVTEADDAPSADRMDVRALAPAQRHDQIFGRIGALEPGETFVLVNDHDPKPLRYQLDAEEPGQITWEYLEQGPEVWQVRIGRVAGHCC